MTMLLYVFAVVSYLAVGVVVVRLTDRVVDIDDSTMVRGIAVLIWPTWAAVVAVSGLVWLLGEIARKS